MLTTCLGVGLDTYLYAEPSRPVFIETVTPFRRDRRWGGDNTDAWYSYAPIDPQRSYVVSGTVVTASTSPSPSTTSRRRARGRTG